MPLQRFYWLIDGSLAGCSRPGGSQISPRVPTAANLAALAADLAWLNEQGIKALLTLTEMPLDTELLSASHLEALHLPIEDLAPPTPSDFLAALEFIDHHRALGHVVAVHCLMGQ